MKIFLMVKRRGAPQDEWKIHSRLKNGWRHWSKRAEKLRKQLGSKFVVKTIRPYNRIIKDNKPFLEPLIDYFLNRAFKKDIVENGRTKN